MNMNNKKIISFLIVFCIIFTMIPPLDVYAIPGNFDRPLTYVKSGEVFTLLKDFDKYYLVRERFGTDSSYLENVVKEEISEDQFNARLQNGGYDVLHVKEIGSSLNGELINQGGGRSYFINYLKNSNGVASATSYIANIQSHNDLYAAFSEFQSLLDNPVAFLYKENNRYFRCHKNDITGITVMTPIDLNTFELLKLDMTGNLLKFSREINYYKDSQGKAHYSDFVYDENGNVIFTLMNDAVEIDVTFDEIESGVVFEDTSVPLEGEAEDAFSEDRYGEYYTSWSDNFNEGYSGAWRDPSYMGTVKTIDWTDPFWKNEDIEQTTTDVQNGYYDDEGTFIKTDSNGNPIPSVPGKFDASGNFKPDDVDGYYDPDGIFHPLFEKIKNINMGKDSSINIDEQGYIDKYGLWHSSTKEFDTIYLYNSKKILANGSLVDENGIIERELSCDLWGNFYDGDYLIYKNGDMLNRVDMSLIKTNGNVLYPQLTPYGNYVYTDGSIVMKDTLVLGTKTGDISVELKNGSIIYETGSINFANGVSYDNGVVILPNSEMVNATFTNGVIDLGSFGKIYSNGHYAEYNKYNNLITDNDCVILNNDMILLENGYILNSNGSILPTYQDGNLNIVTINGNVINRQLRLGIYDQNGNFFTGTLLNEGFYYDRLGNRINLDGTVYQNDIHGHYDHNGVFTEGYSTVLEYYYTCDGHLIYLDGKIERKSNVNGYYDENNNFYMNHGKSYYDNNGTKFSINEKRNYYINNKGNILENKYSDFVVNMDGSISILGASGNYVGKGLFKVNKNIGYYDEYGRFIISNQNTFLLNGGFYDANQKWHNENEVYEDANGNLKLLKNPNLGLKIIDSEHIGFTYNDLSFTKNGITTVDGKTGYYNSSGKFVESNSSPYKGGFYVEGGQWIDNTYYINEFNELSINNGKYIYNGNFITPSGDIGYFNEDKKFILGKNCIYEDYFYDSNGNKISDDLIYIDDLGIYKTFNKNIAVNIQGQQITTNNDKKIVIDGYSYLYLGLFVNSDGLIGHFDKEGNFINSCIFYSEGFYLPDKTFIESSKTYNYGNYIFYKNKNILEINSDSILLYTHDGYVFPITLDKTKYKFSDGSELKDNGEREIEQLEINNKFWVMDKYYIDTEDISGYYKKDGTFNKNDGSYGYYNEAGEYQEGKSNIYMNGFYVKSGEWIGFDSYEPNKGYFNRYGISRNGDNPHLDGYYDEEGSWHIFDRKIYIELDGNAHLLGEDAIGYFDYDGNLHLYDEKGWFDQDGTYIVDNTIMGYYTITGELKRGKNTSFEGFYDMHGRWYKFGSDGYYSSEGEYIDSINGEAIGYYNSVGEFNYGYNLYLTGYYGFNGEWNDAYKDPITTYYNVDGVAKLGEAPYYNGFYDKYGNWYIRGEKGYFDKHGTYYNLVSEDTGYYDAKGIYYEGTNPYIHGYYDSDKNLRLFGQEGHFDQYGTYVDINGENWYFLNGGIKQKSQNPNLDGFYDMHGNWYNFNDIGYYTPDGTFYEFLIEVSAYKVGSADYILFEGVFDNEEYVSTKIRNTIQFSVLRNRNNVRYVDTGIRVPANAMISYDRAKDVLHSISIYNSGIFIEDNDSCILIFDGNIISLKNEGKVSIRELKNMFLDCDIEIVVTTSRINSRFTMTDLIESGNLIKLRYDNKTIVPKNPLIVKNGRGYISLEDLKDLLIYSTKITENESGKEIIRFELKDFSVYEKNSNYYYIIETEIDSNVMNVKLKDVMGKFTLDLENPSVINVKLNEDDTTSIPYVSINNVPIFTKKHLQLDTVKYEIIFIDDKNSEENWVPVTDIY